METQNLLVPEPVDLSPAEAAAALEHRDLLAELGVKIEPFGGDTVLMTGFPAMLANMNPGEVLRALLERLLSRRQAARPPRPAGRPAAHDRLQGGDQGGRPARGRGDRRPAGAAAPGGRRRTIAPTAGPRRWSSRGRNWTSSSSGYRRIAWIRIGWGNVLVQVRRRN